MKFVVQSKQRKMAFVSGFNSEERRTMQKQADNWLDRDCSDISWCGHLVVAARTNERRYLIDASFDQASLPELAIPPTVLVIPIETSIRARDLQFTLKLAMDNGERLEVRYIPLKDHSYRNYEAWQPGHLQPVIRLILGAMENATK